MTLGTLRAQGLRPHGGQRRQVRQGAAEQALRFRPALIFRNGMRADMHRSHNRIPAFSGAQPPDQFV